MPVKEAEPIQRVHVVLFAEDLREISRRWPDLERSVVLRRLVRTQLRTMSERVNAEVARTPDIEVDITDLIEGAQ